MFLRFDAIWLAVAAAVWIAGCGPRTQPLTDEEARRAVSLLMPERIAVMPFTRLESFDDDARPDGIALLVRPINVLGDPVNIVGNIRVELFEFVPASGQPEGRRLQQWDVALADKADQVRYWSSTTQMYEFRLGLDMDLVPKKPKYVLAVTYSTPLGTRLTDEYTLELPIAREPFADAEE